jgi:hypothetical protein
VKVAEREKMATMSALQSSFTSLSLSPSSSFLGQRLISPISLSVTSPVTLIFDFWSIQVFNHCSSF